jgi:hypothetical protein
MPMPTLSLAGREKMNSLMGFAETSIKLGLAYDALSAHPPTLVDLEPHRRFLFSAAFCRFLLLYFLIF